MNYECARMSRAVRSSPAACNGFGFLAAKRKSSGGFAVDLLVDERLNPLGNLALLMAGQLVGRLTKLSFIILFI